MKSKKTLFNNSAIPKKYSIKRKSQNNSKINNKKSLDTEIKIKGGSYDEDVMPPSGIFIDNEIIRKLEDIRKKTRYMIYGGKKNDSRIYGVYNLMDSEDKIWWTDNTFP